MKNFILFLSMLGLCFACDNNNVINENNTKSIGTDTTSTSVVNNEDKNTTESDISTIIDSNECYQLQGYNELGKPVNAYECIMFERNAGRTFDEAFTNIKTDLDLLVKRMVNDEKGGGNYDAEKWEIRNVVRQVKNSPNDKLVYTSIELYMFSIVYKAYIVVYQFCVIDSEGNIYKIVSEDD